MSLARHKYWHETDRTQVEWSNGAKHFVKRVQKYLKRLRAMWLSDQPRKINLSVVMISLLPYAFCKRIVVLLPRGCGKGKKKKKKKGYFTTTYSYSFLFLLELQNFMRPSNLDESHAVAYIEPGKNHYKDFWWQKCYVVYSAVRFVSWFWQSRCCEKKMSRHCPAFVKKLLLWVGFVWLCCSWTQLVGDFLIKRGSLKKIQDARQTIMLWCWKPESSSTREYAPLALFQASPLPGFFPSKGKSLLWITWRSVLGECYMVGMPCWLVFSAWRIFEGRSSPVL